MALYSRATIHPPLAFTHDAQSRIFINAIYRYDLTQILKWRKAIIPNPICIIRAPWTVTFAVCCVFHSTGYIKCYIIFMNEMPKTKLLREAFVRRLFFSRTTANNRKSCVCLFYTFWQVIKQCINWVERRGMADKRTMEICCVFKNARGTQTPVQF